MAVVLTCYYRPKPGGFCERLQRAMQAVLDQGHHLHYLAIKPFPIVHERCTFHRFPWPEAGTDSWFFWGVFHFLAPVMLLWLGLRLHVTHAFGFNPTYAFFLQPLRILRRVQVTCFIRGDALYAHELKKRPKWIIRLDRWIEGMALHKTRVVCLRESLLSRVLRRHPGVRPAIKTILPNDLRVAPAVRRLGDRPLQIGMVGLLEPVKNQAWTLRVMAGLNKKEFHLHFFGQGPDQDGLKALAGAAGLSDCVSFRGWVPEHRIWPQLDLLLMPSLDEGMPNAVLEAIGHHVPVLASDIAAHREILPAIHCLPLAKPELWRDVMKKAAKNPQVVLKDMAGLQFDRARSLRFEWARRVTDLIVPPNRDNTMRPPERLRILIMGNLAPYVIGGAEMQALRLSRHFAARGHHVTVVGHANANAAIDRDRHPGSITSVHLPTIRKNRLTRAISFSLVLGSYLCRHRRRFDLLLTLIIGESSLVAACMKKAKIVKQPLIVRSAGNGSTGDAARLKRLPATPLLVSLLNQTCNAVPTLSPAIERELTSIGMDWRLFVPLGCGVPVFPKKTTGPVNKKNLPRFLFVGRFRPEKRVGDLLRAVHRLVQSTCMPRVHLVGDGPQRRQLESMARSLGIEPCVTFHGAVPPDQVRDFFSGDTVFVVPSINEGHPIALLEAMAAGCPAIVTRNGGSEYLVDEKRGIVCPPCDSRALAAAMHTMIRAGLEKRAAMGAAGRTFVLRHYEQGSVGDRHLDLFRQLLMGGALDPK